MPQQTTSYADHNTMEPSAKDHISVYIEAIFDGGDRLGQPTTPENEFTLPIRNARGSRTSSPSSAPSRAVTMPNPVPQSQSSTPTTSCGSSGPIIKIISQQELERSTMPPSPQGPEASSSSESNVKRKSKSKLSPKFDFVLMSMVYNQYGELVPEHTLHQPAKSEDLNITQILRAISKAYHHSLRVKLGRIIVPQGDGKDAVLVDEFVSKDRLTSWDFKAGAPKAETPDEKESSLSALIPIYRGPPRVLEIGCSDGAWCLNFKKENPEWIVEGIDDTNHWSCVEKDLSFGDFMAVEGDKTTDDYFGQVRSSQSSLPEFTVRDINQLIEHSNPFKHNIYEFIRGREIFDRVESYKTFLDDIRLILKPDGVVEFVEIDPRPRVILPGLKKIADRVHKNSPQTNWTDNIEDRFKDPFDEELATTVPGWNARVLERLKASMRPRDGVVGPNLKSWLEGAGFWDVKEFVIPVPVGGHSRPGMRLKEYVLYQISLEDEVPKLKQELPKPELEAIESGNYHINIHVVNARKPHYPCSGDLLLDGRRQDITESSYDAMARNKAIKTSHWKRFELEGSLDSMFRNLTSLPGAPSSSSLSHKSRFDSPPFVTADPLELYPKDFGSSDN